MVELLPLDALDTWVRPESTDIREGFGKLARLSARRCSEPCFCLICRRLNVASSAGRRRRRAGVVSSRELTVELLRRLRVLLSFPSGIRLSLGRKPTVSSSNSAPEPSSDVPLCDEALGALRGVLRPPLALRESALSASTHAGDVG